MKKSLTLFLFILLTQGVIAQKESNLLKKHEISLLRVLLSDTINNASFILNNTFNFGLNDDLFTYSNIVKKGKDIFIQPLGTGRLYQALKTNNEVGIKRIDETIHSGVNFYARNFFINDTLFQFGGLGFWQIRGIICYYSKLTKQWELIQTNRAVESFFNTQNDAILHFEDNKSAPKLFISNSYYYPNYPSSFETQSTDSCYEYDFNLRKWITLGKISTEFKKIMERKKSSDFEINIDHLYIFQNQLEFYWVDFKKNKFGQFNAKENNKLRQRWLSFYNKNKVRQQTEIQFNLGKDLYYIKMDPGADIEWVKSEIDINALDNINTFNIYNNKTSILENINQWYSKHKTSVFIVLSILLLAIGFSAKFFKKKNIPKEVVAILYQNFFTSLSIVEKELIEILCQSNLKGEEVSTKTINKIIGVQQKDTLIQNKSRSDIFIRINQKFKMATQNTELLIVKNRDKIDKRQYNYGLNQLYLTAIEKLFKD
jgi:hypothetical protein